MRKIHLRAQSTKVPGESKDWIIETTDSGGLKISYGCTGAKLRSKVMGVDALKGVSPDGELDKRVTKQLKDGYEIVSSAEDTPEDDEIFITMTFNTGEAVTAILKAAQAAEDASSDGVIQVKSSKLGKIFIGGECLDVGVQGKVFINTTRGTPVSIACGMFASAGVDGLRINIADGSGSTVTGLHLYDPAGRGQLQESLTNLAYALRLRVKPIGFAKIQRHDGSVITPVIF